jgi:hypothetical protein
LHHRAIVTVIGAMRNLLVFALPLSQESCAARRFLQMCRYHRLWVFRVGPLLGVLFLGLAGCSSPASVPAGEGGNPSVQQGAFPDQSPGSIESTQDSRQITGDESVAQEQTEGLPTGTLITVRLKDDVPAAAANGVFEALVDEPVTVQGEARIPRGTLVEGRIESVRTSEASPDRSVVQLTLDSFRLGGVDIPINTASLFGRQTAIRQASISAVLLEKGRRLTFRLTEKVSLHVQRTRAGR